MVGEQGSIFGGREFLEHNFQCFDWTQHMIIILDGTEPEVIETQEFYESNNGTFLGIRETCCCELTKSHEGGKHSFACIPSLGFVSTT